MPTLSIWSIRLALIYFVVGMAFGAILLVNKGLAISGSLWIFLPLHIQCVLWGWTLQLIIGVAYWMLPTFGARTNRGREKFALASVILLNVGVLMTLSTVLLRSPYLNLMGSLLITASAFSFALHAWPRIKPFGTS